MVDLCAVANMDVGLATQANRAILSWHSHLGHAQSGNLSTAHDGQVPVSPTFKSNIPKIYAAQNVGAQYLDINAATQNNFLLDRELLLRSGILERLRGITQVFSPQERGVTSRYDHSESVSIIASEIAKRLGINEVLAETIAWGHDCAHGPGGHVFEDTISTVFTTGFDHGNQATKLLSSVSDHFHDETLDGIGNHSWKAKTPMTAEAEVVSWADRISYVVSDFVDGCVMGIVDVEDLTRDVRIDNNVADLMKESPESVQQYFIDCLVESSRVAGYVCMNTKDANQLLAIRDFNMEHIIQSPFRMEQDARFRDALIQILEDLTGEIVEARASAPEGSNIPIKGITSSRMVDFLLTMRDQDLLEFHDRLNDRTQPAGIPTSESHSMSR